jgi:site-specific recombinase XerD
MINHFYSGGWDVAHLRRGPLGPYLDGVAGGLFNQGYAIQTGRAKIRFLSDLSRWLERRKIRSTDVTEEQLGRFGDLRERQHRLRRGDRQTLKQLLGYLREIEVIRQPRRLVKKGLLDRTLEDFTRFLTEQRGLTQATLDNYLPVARSFLETRFGTGRIHLDRLRVADVTGFVARHGSHWSSKRCQLVASGLRSFLGFLTQEGTVTTNLAAAVPTIAAWRLTGLPQFLEPGQVEKLLRACPRHTGAGRRDLAVLLLLARLGLRAGEVVHLNLEDIDWEAGEIFVRGKSARQDRLPLSSEVGEALARYLKRDRPRCGCRRVFLRLRAPHQGFSSSVAICDIFRRALARARLDPENKGAHLLRRSLATTMLRRGASLTQIGQVLRHQLAQTTEIYAKVDLAALRGLAQPWPGGVR